MTRLTRVYFAGFIQVGDEIVLPENASHHVMTVLRVIVKQALIVFNGDGYEYLVEVASLQKKAVRLLVLEKITVSRESPLKIELVQGISRGERMEYAIQKAVELGVSEITPVFTERCGVKLAEDRMLRRMEHWQAIIIGACEQSGRLQLPTLHAPQTVSRWLLTPTQGLRLVCSPKANAQVF